MIVADQKALLCIAVTYIGTGVLAKVQTEQLYK